MESLESPHKMSGSEVIPTSNAVYDASVDFVGGILGGAASVFIGQPLDTVKVKLQTFPTSYSNAMDCFTKTYKQEGVTRGLYAGTLPSLAAQVSENSILFLAYGFCQKGLAMFLQTKNVKELNPVHNALAGSLAAFWSSLALCPTELIKCKLQAMEQLKCSGEVTETVPRGALSLTSQILKQEGILGLYRGFFPTIMREMPGYFFFFGGYETSRYLLTPDDKSKDDLSAVSTMLCGGIGGMSLWLAVFPADVIKSRVQVHTIDNMSRSQLGFFSMFRNIVKNEGVTALYKGLGPTLLRTFPATGGLFLAYETTKSLLEKQTCQSSYSS